MKPLFIILIFFIFALSGCTMEDAEGNNTDLSGQTVTFSLITGNNDNATRSTPGDASLNENLVERLDVFFFDNDGQCIYYPSTSQMVKSGTTIKITIPKDIATIIFSEDFKLYIVSNCTLPRNVLEEKTYNQLIETIHGVPTEFNKSNFESQPYFLMDGVLPVNNLTEDNSNLGEITLSRAAAKIKVQITAANISGYIPYDASIRIDNYLESTTLGQEAPLFQAQDNDYKRSAYRPIWVPGMTATQFDTDPFYSYANDWELSNTKETYITIRVKWYKVDGGVEPKDYYYRIPFNYSLPTPDEGNNHSLQRNFIYNFKVNIGALGGLDPDQTVELTPDFEIKEWTTNRIVAKLNQYDYLVVAETDVEMHDIANRSINYISSQPVSVEMDSVYFYNYLSSGTIETIELVPGDDRYPRIEPNEDTNQIEITSPVPINYVPLMMRFKVKNTKGLYYNVRVTQYPRQYITSSFSDRDDIDFQWYKDNNRGSFWTNSGNGNTGRQNFNLYTVTTTSMDPSDKFIIGGDFMHYEKNSADFDAINYVTNQDEATNNMVSPQFVIASQRGITDNSTAYTSAQLRCYYYMEGPYGRGTWRIPTLAEMELISKLQNDGNSAIKELFKPNTTGGDRWWAARIDGEPQNTNSYYYSVKVMTGEVVRQKYVSGSTTASVRCVRDVWKN